MTAPACPPLDLGGRTVDNPCLGAFGLYCTPWDYWSCRRILQNERLALIDRLNRYNNLVAAGRAKWTAATSAAHALCNGASYDLLAEYGESNWNIFRDGQRAEEPARLFLDMATKVHGATCDVEAALGALGEVLPQRPPPIQAPQSFPDKLADAMLGLAKSAGIVGAVIFGGILLFRQARTAARDP